VFQDFSLIGLPISQNIAISADYDLAKVKDALAKAGAPDLDLSTLILKDYGNKGVNISGGEA
jgi:ATP-binding cassette subfamily B protein